MSMLAGTTSTDAGVGRVLQLLNTIDPDTKPHTFVMREVVEWLHKRAGGQNATPKGEVVDNLHRRAVS